RLLRLDGPAVEEQRSVPDQQERARQPLKRQVLGDGYVGFQLVPRDESPGRQVEEQQQEDDVHRRQREVGPRSPWRLGDQGHGRADSALSRVTLATDAFFSASSAETTS